MSVCWEAKWPSLTADLLLMCFTYICVLFKAKKNMTCQNRGPSLSTVLLFAGYLGTYSSEEEGPILVEWCLICLDVMNW